MRRDQAAAHGQTNMMVTKCLDETDRSDFAPLICYCDELAAGRPMPFWAEFRAARIRSMLGRVYLVDVLDGGADYRFRLFGEVWQTVYGIDLTGRCLSELEAADLVAALRSDYDAVVRSRELRFRPATLVWPNGKTISYRRLLIPFADALGNVSVILTAAKSSFSADDLILERGRGLPQVVLADTPTPENTVLAHRQ